MSKQETLEEAAEKYANQFIDGRDDYYGFIEGAKWQQERSYSEAIEFSEWKDDHFIMYHNKTYYAKPSSVYFDITKYVGKEKPTKYYTTEELLTIYKEEL